VEHWFERADSLPDGLMDSAKQGETDVWKRTQCSLFNMFKFVADSRLSPP